MRDRFEAGQDPVADNALGREFGATRVLAQFNDGHTTVDWSPPSVIRAFQLPLRSSQWAYSLFAIGALTACMFGLALPGRERWIGPAAALSNVGVAVLLSTSYIDIQRYLLPYVLTNLVVASWIIGRLMSTRGERA